MPPPITLICYPYITYAALILLILTSGTARASANGQTQPKTTPPPAFIFDGNIRAFYFGRTNGDACLICTPKGSPDATAFNFGGRLNGQFNFPHSPWAIGATYFGAHPLGANSPGQLNNIGYNPSIDNTVPGYPLSVFGEAYVQYRSAGTFAQAGKEILRVAQSPWANPADTRLEPIAFQGTLISTNPTPDLAIGAMYMARFKSRISSAFNANTLLTSCDTAFPTGKGPEPGVKGTFTVPGDSCNKQQTAPGFSEFSVSYIFGSSGLVTGVYQYQIYDIASMTWITSQYNFDKESRFNPYLAAQILRENNVGMSLIGTVHNYTLGGQVGAALDRNLSFVVGYDSSRPTGYVVPAKACSGSASSPTAPSPGAIFGGVPATTSTALPEGYVTCYGGGIASPYTDGYTADPLFTTSLTQGMVEARKPGLAVKGILTWQSHDRRLKLIASDGWYNYSLPGGIAGVSNNDSRSEFDLDAQYFFSPARSNNLYRGFSIRQRYGDRTQPFVPFEFKSSRTQFEYSF